LHLSRFRRVARRLIPILLACGTTACGDPLAETSAGFTLTSTTETGGTIRTITGSAATWRVVKGTDADGFSVKNLRIDLITAGGADLIIWSESGRLTGSVPGIGGYRVGDGRNGTVLMTDFLSTDGSATDGGVVIMGASSSTVQGHLDVWFGTPGTASQSAFHLIGDFIAKSSDLAALELEG
jgi:hypothetical protein